MASMSSVEVKFDGWPQLNDEEMPSLEWSAVGRAGWGRGRAGLRPALRPTSSISLSADSDMARGGGGGAAPPLPSRPLIPGRDHILLLLAFSFIIYK